MKNNKDKKRTGQGLTEYALILALVTLIVVFALSNMGQNLKTVFTIFSIKLGNVNQMSQSNST